MADMSLNAKSLLNQITNDVKMRSLFEKAGADLNSTSFLDVMMARLTALGSTDADLKALLNKAAQSEDSLNASEIAYTKNLNGVKENKEKSSAAEASAVAPKSEIKAKIKAKIKEIAERHNAEVSDDSALKTLQKVADFLIKAEAAGKIDLPAGLTEKLQAFLAKGDDLKAFDVAEFMHDFITAFRSMVVSLNQPVTSGEDALQWPQEIVDSLKELGMESFVAENGKPLDIRSILQTVKALVNASETAAVDTLNAKADSAILPQDQAAILAMGAAPAAATVPVAPATVSEAAPAPEVAAQTLEEKISALIIDSMKAVKEQENQAAGKTADPVLDMLNNVSKAKDKAAVPTILVSEIEAALSGKKQVPSVSDSLKDFSFDSALSNKKSDGYMPRESGNAGSQSQNNTTQTVFRAEAAPVNVAEIKSNVTNATTHNGVTALNAAEGVHAPSVTATQNAALRSAMQTANAQPAPATQQVLVQIQTKMNKDTQISVQLSPAELGRVDVRLTIDRNGQAHAMIMADKPETLALLQKDASFLERALQQAGINAQSQNMSFNLREERHPTDFGQGRKRFTREGFDDKTIADVSLAVSAEGSVISDKRVNYHA